MKAIHIKVKANHHLKKNNNFFSIICREGGFTVLTFWSPNPCSFSFVRQHKWLKKRMTDDYLQTYKRIWLLRVMGSINMSESLWHAKSGWARVTMQMFQTYYEGCYSSVDVLCLNCSWKHLGSVSRITLIYSSQSYQKQENNGLLYFNFWTQPHSKVVKNWIFELWPGDHHLNMSVSLTVFSPVCLFSLCDTVHTPCGYLGGVSI